MKKTIIWILLALVSGGILGKITIDEYKSIDVKEMIKIDNDVYALYYNTYSNVEEMAEDITCVDKYIYIEENDKIYVYFGITKTNTNAKKLKKIYKNKNINVSIVKITIDNDAFIQNLDEYEKLLSATEEENSIMIVENQILSCYTDTVMNYE